MANENGSWSGISALQKNHRCTDFTSWCLMPHTQIARIINQQHQNTMTPQQTKTHLITKYTWCVLIRRNQRGTR